MEMYVIGGKRQKICNGDYGGKPRVIQIITFECYKKMTRREKQQSLVRKWGIKQLAVRWPGVRNI